MPKYEVTLTQAFIIDAADEEEAYDRREHLIHLTKQPSIFDNAAGIGPDWVTAWHYEARVEELYEEETECHNTN